VGVGFIMILLAVAAYRGRRAIGRGQARALKSSFNIGEGKQPGIAAGLATVWVAVSVLFLIGGLVTIAADVITR
jgi:hypothetical protein